MEYLAGDRGVFPNTSSTTNSTRGPPGVTQSSGTRPWRASSEAPKRTSICAGNFRDLPWGSVQRLAFSYLTATVVPLVSARDGTAVQQAQDSGRRSSLRPSSGIHEFIATSKRAYPHLSKVRISPTWTFAIDGFEPVPVRRACPVR